MSKKVFSVSGNNKSDVAGLLALLRHGGGYGNDCSDGYLEDQPGSGRFFTVGVYDENGKHSRTDVSNWKGDNVTVEPVSSENVGDLLDAMNNLGISDTFSYYV